MKSYGHKGFTLVEVLVALALAVVMGVVVMMSLRGRKSVLELDNTVIRMTALLREAQSRTSAGESSSNWGVHFENTSSSPFFALFSGAYAATTTLNRAELPRFVRYGNIAPSETLDVVFASSTGRPTATSSIVLEQLSGGTVTKTVTISVNAVGAISY